VLPQRDALCAAGTLAVPRPTNPESVRLFALLQGISKSIQRLVEVWENEVTPYSAEHPDFHWWTPKYGVKGAASMYSRCKKVYEIVSAAWARQAQQSHGQTTHQAAREKQIQIFQRQCDCSGGIGNLTADLVTAEQLHKKAGSPNPITIKDIAAAKEVNEKLKREKKEKRAAGPNSNSLNIKKKRKRRGVGVPGLQSIVEFQVVHQVATTEMPP
jgi:hypothetical protein